MSRAGRVASRGHPDSGAIDVSRGIQARRANLEAESTTETPMTPRIILLLAVVAIGGCAYHDGGRQGARHGGPHAGTIDHRDYRDYHYDRRAYRHDRHDRHDGHDRRGHERYERRRDARHDVRFGPDRQPRGRHGEGKARGHERRAQRHRGDHRHDPRRDRQASHERFERRD
ncbi:hypothetical protein [Salinisphaera orenii]|uniref:hypothetical protein n=1 Tax=Salinisphaera orenii TaxID=856731 RepID=UPI0011CE0FD4|nr:hypothetical protein [Salinisphaera halophila]